VAAGSAEVAGARAVARSATTMEAFIVSFEFERTVCVSDIECSGKCLRRDDGVIMSKIGVQRSVIEQLAEVGCLSEDVARIHQGNERGFYTLNINAARHQVPPQHFDRPS
jgi:hypothetical protein